MTDHARAIEAGARADLLPCPFCGAEGHTLVRGFRYRRGSSERESTVWCPACDCRGPLKSWNTRAIASGELVPAAQLTAMRERCAKVVDGYAPATTDMLSSKIAEICDDIVTDIRALSPEPTSGDFVVVPAKPIGRFNPWNDYHGFQQVAPEFEGDGETIPLYADQKTHDDLKAASRNGDGK